MIHIHIIVSINDQLFLYCFCIRTIISPFLFIYFFCLFVCLFVFVFVPAKETSLVAGFGVKVFLFNSLVLEVQLLNVVASRAG